jgi:hypothetical protein
MFQRRAAGPAATAFDVQVYRAQLLEVDRDVMAGRVSEPDAERLRVEISRRILEADRAGRGGEIRPVAHGALRLKESAKLGFNNALVPPSVKGQAGFSTQEFRTLANLVDHMLGRG